MKNELAVRDQQALVVATQQQMALLKNTLADGLSDDEFKLYVAVCNRTRLDPFAKQIHAVKRGGKLVIQTGIDGFRLTAQRSGEYEGQTAPEWCSTDGVWLDVWTDDKPPHAARVGIYRKGFREPVYGVALYRGYVQRHNGEPMLRWASDPAGMLAKCAEALAIRKAFPQELSGLYADVEMAQADNTGPTVQMPRRKGESEPPAQRADDAITTTVERVSKRSGKKGGKPWTLYTVHTPAGDFSTFSETDADVASSVAGSGQSVSIEWEQRGDYRNVVSIEPEG